MSHAQMIVGVCSDRDGRAWICPSAALLDADIGQKYLKKSTFGFAFDREIAVHFAPFSNTIWGPRRG